MKLRTKLMIAFLSIILIPIALFGLFGVAIVRVQSEVIRSSYGINADLSDMFMGSSRLYDRLMQKVQDNIAEEISAEPELLENKEALKKYLAGEAGGLINVVVLKDGDLYYAHNRLETAVLRELIAAAEEESRNETAIYIRRQSILMGRAFEGSFADGSACIIYTVADVRQQLPEIRRMIFQFALTMVFVLVLTACFFTVWIYRSVVRPLRALQQATENIRRGDMDFTLEVLENDELGELTAAFEQMREKLKEGSEQKLAFDQENRDLIRNISHDLKTPLTTIRGYAEGLLDGVADTEEKKERYLRMIIGKADEMQSLIDELSFYSRIDSNRIPYNFRKLDIGEFLSDCAAELEEELSAEQTDFAYENRAGENIIVLADPEQLHRVIQNITDNSRKYCNKEKNSIRLVLQEAGDFVTILVQDNGCGIAQKDIPYIFDRFYRTDASRNSGTGGSGIGLSIVKKIVEDHGGRVYATSLEGEGTSILFELPRYKEPDLPGEGEVAELADRDLKVIFEPEKPEAKENPREGSVKA